MMTAAAYRESLRRLSPRVFVDGRQVESVADDPALAPGINAVGITYDFAHVPAHQALMTARQGTSGKAVNRMLHIDETSSDLLAKLEAVRLVCRESGCAQRYVAHDMLNGLFQATRRADAAHGTDYHQRFLAYLHRVQGEDLAIGGAMTDAKGDRSLRPGAQANPDVYLHIAARRKDGIVIRGTKAIVTGAPYMHELLVMPCRTMTKEDADFAVCCAVPVDDHLAARRRLARGDEARDLAQLPARRAHAGGRAAARARGRRRWPARLEAAGALLHHRLRGPHAAARGGGGEVARGPCCETHARARRHSFPRQVAIP